MTSTPGAAGPGAPFPQWTVSTENYQVAEVSSATEKDIAEASVFPFKLIFFTSQSAAETYAKAHGGGETAPPGLQQGANVVAGAANAAGAAASGNLLGTLSDFLGIHGNVSGKNLAIRAAKMIVGATMIIVGIAKLTGAEGAITSAAKGVVK